MYTDPKTEYLNLEGTSSYLIGINLVASPKNDRSLFFNPNVVFNSDNLVVNITLGVLTNTK